MRVLDIATDDLDAVLEAERAWRSATEGRRARSRLLSGRAAGSVVLLIEYASAADAGCDDDLPETAELLGALARLAGAPPAVWTVEIDAADAR